jgi:hypothetical protein
MAVLLKQLAMVKLEQASSLNYHCKLKRAKGLEALWL